MWLANLFAYELSYNTQTERLNTQLVVDIGVRIGEKSDFLESAVKTSDNRIELIFVYAANKYII